MERLNGEWRKFIRNVDSVVTKGGLRSWKWEEVDGVGVPEFYSRSPKRKVPTSKTAKAPTRTRSAEIFTKGYSLKETTRDLEEDKENRPQLDGSGDALNVSADLLPPPPPPAVMTNSSDNLLSTSFHADHPPPPPPPPPPPLPPSSTTGEFPPKPVLPGPPRDLLSDIRAGGFQLRKVSERQLPARADVKYSTTSRICDVSAIFEMVSRRRQCLENTSEDDDDKTSDSCGWED
ncbi:wiskott Aldrich syndrome protein family member [Echinococcus multilocularis]|uniref:Wiskott Aldrich syndrome protein family member n=1 Tax=Echinococcus multilocularis TaxID=6211 RepID=A0A0S4MJP7_ECHMU|nr:wiskott Aldrich syndrome protein family member [Echinococcus multilocularis]